VREAE